MNPSLEHYASIAMGSALGGLLRYSIGAYIARYYGGSFPWGTLAVNVIGGFVIGWAATRAQVPWVRFFVMVGLCGGFTTFSSFSLETLTLLREGQATRACLYVCASVLSCLASVFLGFRLGKF